MTDKHGKPLNEEQRRKVIRAFLTDSAKYERPISSKDSEIPPHIRIYDDMMLSAESRACYYELFQHACNVQTHNAVANLFRELIRGIKCSDPSTLMLWEYDELTGLWERLHVATCVNLMCALLNHCLDQAFMGVSKVKKGNKIFRDELLANIKKLEKKIGNNDFRNKAIKDYSASIYDKTFLEKLNKNPYYINFKNGLIDMRTGEFRKRKRDDYVSETLPYEFVTAVTKDQENEIYDALLHTCNDDEELLKANLKWRAYGMTGLREQQYALFTIGHKAENGKSTLLHIFDACLSIYTKTLDSAFFNKGYQYRDKDLTDLKDKPIRYVAVEEADTKKMDTSYFKHMVDSKKLPIKPLYSKTIEIVPNIVIEIISNHTPQFNTDKGMLRRMLTQELTNCFYKEQKYEQAVKENKGVAPKGVYLADPDFLKRIEKYDSYKSAFIKLLLPYAKEYCETRTLKLPDSWFTNAQDICDENDKMKDFIDTYFERTGNKADRIFKKSFEQMYNNENKTKTPWSLLLSDIKRLGILYDRNLCDKDKNRGVLLGIREKNEKNNDLN